MSSNYVLIPSDAKRLIGRKFEDSAVQADMKHWPFDVISEGGKPKIRVIYKGESKLFFPEEISSMVLTKMKETAEAYLGKVISYSYTVKNLYTMNLGYLKVLPSLRKRMKHQGGQK